MAHFEETAVGYKAIFQKTFNDTSADNTAEFTCTGSVNVDNAVEFGTYVYFIQNSYIKNLALIL